MMVRRNILPEPPWFGHIAPTERNRSYTWQQGQYDLDGRVCEPPPAAPECDWKRAIHTCESRPLPANAEDAEDQAVHCVNPCMVALMKCAFTPRSPLTPSDSRCLSAAWCMLVQMRQQPAGEDLDGSAACTQCGQAQAAMPWDRTERRGGGGAPAGLRQLAAGEARGDHQRLTVLRHVDTMWRIGEAGRGMDWIVQEELDGV